MIKVSIPYTVYRVPVELRGRMYTVNLTPNSSDRKLGYARNVAFRRILVSKAQQQCYDDAYIATRAAEMPVLPPDGGPLYLGIEVWTRTRALKDVDGLLSGAKHFFDGVASSLETNDARFRFNGVVFNKGEERTEITIGY